MISIISHRHLGLSQPKFWAVLFDCLFVSCTCKYWHLFSFQLIWESRMLWSRNSSLFLNWRNTPKLLLTQNCLAKLRFVPQDCQVFETLEELLFFILQERTSTWTEFCDVSSYQTLWKNTFFSSDFVVSQSDGEWLNIWMLWLFFDWTTQTNQNAKKQSKKGRKIWA